jgi:hypothetical protein
MDAHDMGKLEIYFKHYIVLMHDARWCSPFKDFKHAQDQIAQLTTKECGFSHAKSYGSWQGCKVNFVVSSITMYNNI